MSEESGIDMMRARIQRGRRQPPSPRRSPGGEDEPGREPLTPVDRPTVETSTAVVAAVPERGAEQDAEAPARASRTARKDAPLRLSPALPWANLAIRVRRPLDDRLADLIHELRREGVRTSKVEVIEMLLWELPPDDVDGLRKRITRFRRHAPRSSAADLDG